MKAQLLVVLIAVLAAVLFFGTKNAFSRNSGEIRAEIVLFAHQTKKVNRMLPPELELAQQSLTNPALEHPIVLVHSHQKNVRSDIVDNTPIDYYEQSLIIPYVKFRDGRPGIFSYVYKSYLSVENGTLPLYIGWLMGYNKHFANFRESSDKVETLYESFTPDTNVKMSRLRYHLEASVVPPSKLQNFHRVQELFQLPIVGKTPWGSLVCSKINYNLHNANAKDFERASFTYEENFSKDFSGTERSLSRTIHSMAKLPEVLGMPTPSTPSLSSIGFHLEAKWTLTDPWSDCSNK